MTSIYKRSIIYIFIISLCFSVISEAVTPQQDSVINKKDQVKNIAYGTKPSWAVSGAISTVPGNELQKSYTLNLGNTLYGRLSGLTVMQGGGEPGLQSPSLRIRGLNTFNSGTAVLIIVDGFESPYDHLVPEEIESMTLLKDASATAIYGSKGANGVLLVTTKRGYEGPLKISFTTQQGVMSPTHLPKFLGSYDYATLYNEALVNDGKPALYSATDLDAYKTGSDPLFHPDVNWYDQVLRKSAMASKYDLNFSGGNNTVHYFVLLDYMSDGGLYKKTKGLSDYSTNSKYTKLNYRSNVDFFFTRNFSAKLSIGGSVMDKSNPAALNTSTIFNNLAQLPPNSFPVYNPGGSYSSNLLYSNPWGDLLEKGLYTSNGRVFQANMKLTEKLDMITQGLSISAAVAFNSSFTSVSSKSRTYVSYSIKDDGFGNPIFTKIGQNSSLSGSEGESDQWRRYAIQGFLDYDRNFGTSNLNGVVVFTESNYSYSGIGLPYKDRSLAGRLTYTKNEKYVGEFSFGYCGSKEYPEGKRWGFFPAASLGWIVSNEGFLKGSSFMNFLKLRGSYGMTGNDNIGIPPESRFMWNQTYGYMTPYITGTGTTSNSTIGEGRLANPDVTWEKQKELNIGLEGTLIKNIDFKIDVFQRDRYDILATPYRDLPGFLGVQSQGLNVGKVNNKGFEAMIRFNSDNTKDLQYFVQADVWYTKNKIVYNSEALQLYDWLYKTGQQVNQPFVYQFAGFYADAADIASSPRQIFSATVVPGDMKYKDLNGDNLIDQNDLYPSGNTTMPTITAALHTGLKYKGFDLDILFQGVSGRTVYLNGNYFQAFQNNAQVSEIALGRWTSSTAATATYPRLSTSGNMNNFQNSSFWQRNGNFIKLRSIELGYSIPGSLTSKLKLNDARVFLNGTDLFSFDHMDFTDPETITGYPPVRTISIGLRLQM